MAPHIIQQLNRAHVAARSRAGSTLDRLREERGEGVISTAIAVLVMAFLGVAMWFAFEAIFDAAADRAGEQVDQIGGSGN